MAVPIAGKLSDQLGRKPLLIGSMLAFVVTSLLCAQAQSFSQLVGGLALLGLGFTREFWPFFTLMLVHCLLYVPTISITNQIAFAHMRDPQKEFGVVRMGGTIGWILAAWPFTFILVDWDKVRAANPQGWIDCLP